jgi:hypothetical protein
MFLFIQQFSDFRLRFFLRDWRVLFLRFVGAVQRDYQAAAPVIRGEARFQVLSESGDDFFKHKA